MGVADARALLDKHEGAVNLKTACSSDSQGRVILCNSAKGNALGKIDNGWALWQRPSQKLLV